jgi:hypothetical protein
MRTIICALTTSLTSLALNAASPANTKESPAAVDPDAGALALPYKTGEQIHGGRVVFAEGNATNTRADRFMLDGLSVMQPVVVSLVPKDPKVRLTLTVGKGGGKPPSKQADTGTKGLASVGVRTQGAAYVTVRANASTTPYQVMVWVGPEIKPALASPFKSVKPDVLRQRK